MNIRTPSCDVYGEYYIYKNAFCYKDLFLPEGGGKEGEQCLDNDEVEAAALKEVEQEEHQAMFYHVSNGEALRMKEVDNQKEADSLSDDDEFEVLPLTRNEVPQIEAATHLAKKNQDDERCGNEALVSSASDYVYIAQIMR
jgi:hypothetical protein